MNKRRDSYLDVFRGIVALWIVVIHVAFHNSFGQPEWLRSFTLLLDVPAFFFLSGMTRAVVGKEMLIGAVIRLSTTFAFCVLLLMLFNGSPWERKVLVPAKYLLFSSEKIEGLESFVWSYWFVPCYLVVLLFAEALVARVSRFKYLVGIGLFLPIPFMFLARETSGFPVLGVDSRDVFFYLPLFLFGYFIREKVIFTGLQKRAAIGCLIAGAVGWGLCALFLGEDAFQLQAKKFPAQLPYVCASMISVSAIIFFYRDLSGRFRLLEHVGRNAIYYYCGQAFATSLMRDHVTPYVNLAAENWVGRFVILVPIGLLITVGFSEVLRYLLDQVVALIRRAHPEAR
ncbi:acyltransferase [Luteolibacter soli]|uniref:Acyltransferase n=1 Tax=Luteolibacter soli TaxID=3135280 RepID=A0ABU9ARS0_9BACT